MLRRFILLGRLSDSNFRRKHFSIFNKLKNDTKYVEFGIGYLGHFAEGSVLCRKENSLVHAVVTCKSVPSTGVNFLPLTVDYRNRSSAHGLIPTSSNRRDRQSSDDEILVGRIIDRAIRPLFPALYSNEVQVLVTAHAVDKNVDPIVLAVNAASVALMVSNQPWNGPIACVRIGFINNELKVNPTSAEMKESKLNLIYAATKKRPLMIETLAHEISEDILISAMRLAQSEIIQFIDIQKIAIEEYIKTKPTSSITNTVADVMEENKNSVISPSQSIQLINDTTSSTSTSNNNNSNELLSSQSYQHISDIIPSEITTTITTNDGIITSNELIKDDEDINIIDDLPTTTLITPTTPSDELSTLLKISDRIGYQKAIDVFKIPYSSKSERGKAEGKLQTELQQAIASDIEAIQYPSILYNYAIGMTMKKAFRQVILEGVRFDGRGLNELRPLSSMIEVLPETVHGSSFFQRGDTHVLSSTTLGSRNDAKLSTSLGTGEVDTQSFLLHYDFPPYSTGSVGNSVSLNRRMIGHGNLAEKSLLPVLPDLNIFPYTVRVYSECTSSNGSSSMASVCGATLSLMDAGVPIKSPVAGISIGLVSAPNAKEDEENAINPSEWVLLSDINGSEDYYGDMDFKIAGSRNGVTAIQLDIKLPNGVPLSVLEAALLKAKEGRLKILEHMSTTCIDAPRSSLKPSAPRAEIISFDPERLRHLLGPGGEMIRYIRKEFDVTVDTDDEGHAYIFGRDSEKVKHARILVQDLVMDIKQGDKYFAEVTEIRDFGAIVKVTRAQDALLHVSELSHDVKLLRKPLTELLTIGQRVEVQVIAVDKGSGTISVSRKKLLDAKSTIPDTLLTEFNKSDITTKHLSFATLPTFPVVPPKKFNIDFFRFKTAESAVVSSATPDNKIPNNITSSFINEHREVPNFDSNNNNNKDKAIHSTKPFVKITESKKEKIIITTEKAKAKNLKIKKSGDKIWIPDSPRPKKTFTPSKGATRRIKNESEKLSVEVSEELELIINNTTESSQVAVEKEVNNKDCSISDILDGKLNEESNR